LSRKAVKIVLAVVLFAAAAVFAWRSLSSDSPIPRDFAFVDVETGELFDLSLRNVGVIPAKSPKTGKFTLLPCKKDEHGVMRVNEPFRASLHDELKSINKYVDPFTLEVKKQDGK
jgi:hypothetical protein